MSTIEDEKNFEEYYILTCEYAELKNIEEPERDAVKAYYEEKESYTQIVIDTLELHDN